MTDGERFAADAEKRTAEYLRSWMNVPAFRQALLAPNPHRPPLRMPGTPRPRSTR